MRALSKDEIFKEERETEMSEANESAISGIKNVVGIENDYTHNGHYDPRDPQFRWNGPCGTLPDHNALATADIQRRQAIQQAHDDKFRAALATAEKVKGSPLSHNEREIVRLSLK